MFLFAKGPLFNLLEVQRDADLLDHYDALINQFPVRDVCIWNFH